MSRAPETFGNHNEISSDLLHFRIDKINEAAEVAKVLGGKHPFYRIIFIKEGIFEYNLAGRVMRLQSASKNITNSNNKLSALANDDRTSGFLISFSQTFLQLSTGSDWLQRFHFPLDHVESFEIPTTIRPFLSSITTRLFQEFESHGMKDGVVVELFKLFLLYVERSLQNSSLLGNDKSTYYVRKFFTLLDQNFPVSRMPSAYASQMAVSTAHLNKLIKESIGMTTSHCIQQRIFLEAKRLMRDERLNMKQVANKLGFIDESHFSKYFKRNAQESFSIMKKNLST